MSFLSLNKYKVLVSLLAVSAGALGTPLACQVVDKGEYDFDDARFNGTAGTTGTPQGGAGGEGGPGSDCTEGEFFCTDAGELLACVDGVFEAEGEGMACGDPALCSAAAGACRECSPGEFRCSGAELEQCNLEGADWDLITTCVNEDACNVSTNRQRGYCTLCEPGTSVCDPKVVLTAGVQGAGAGSAQAASELRECNEDGSGTTLTDTCGFDQPVCDAAEGACLRCPPNETRCINGRVEICEADGSAWEEDDDCGTVALCDQLSTDGPECLNPTCTLGAALTCDSAGLIEGCGLDGEPFEILDCPSQVRCDATKRRCTACEPGTFRCVGQDVRWCGGLFLDDDSVAQSVTVRPTLPNPGVETTVARCDAGCAAPPSGGWSCSDYALVCDMSTGAPGYRYPSYYDYNLGMGTQCDSGEYCTSLDIAGFCAVCRPNQAWCNGDNELVKCNADGSAFDAVEDCGDNVCAYWLEQCLPALPGDNACLPDGRLVRVEGDGAITELDQCSGPAACDPERGCLIGACRTGSTVCDGADVLDCTDGSATAPSGDECSSATRCSPGFGCNEPFAIAAGEAHTCAIFAAADSADGDAGFVKCWGANESGQLGNGSSVLGDSAEPRYVVRYDDAEQTQPPVAIPNATSVCAGKDFSCATVNTPDGSRVACWGSNAKGQLGTDSTEVTPFNHAGALVTTGDAAIAATSVACGGDFACALGADGSTWCWGANDFGQVGNGAAGDPVLVATLLADHLFVGIAAGAHHACGVKDDGAVFCWGQGMGGQVGSGDADDVDAPAQVGGVEAIITILPALGRDFSIVASQDANPAVFGTNGFGQLATGDTSNSNEPVAGGELNNDEIDNLFAGATSAHACARIASTLVCWGANVFGQVGDDTTDTAFSPAEVMDGATNSGKVKPGVHTVAVGGKHTCAINAEGDILCWGANHRGQLGTDATTPVTQPTLSF